MASSGGSIAKLRSFISYLLGLKYGATGIASSSGNSLYRVAMGVSRSSEGSESKLGESVGAGGKDISIESIEVGAALGICRLMRGNGRSVPEVGRLKSRAWGG